VQAQKKNPYGWASGCGGRDERNKVSTTEAHAYGFFVSFIALPTRPDLSLRQTNLSHNFKFLPAVPKNN